MGEWPVRIMVYGAGEAIDGEGALSGYIERQLGDLERVCTNPIVAATAQLDATGAQSRRSVLDPRGLQPILSIPNVNVGDPAHLLDFAEWSAAICPAARSILVLSGHGLAWQDSQANELLGRSLTRSLSTVPPVPGAIRHARALFGPAASSSAATARAVLFDGHHRDYLSNVELGAACQRVSRELGRPIDVTVFDACLMSSIEILQELRGSVAMVVGSIDELSAAGIKLADPAQRLTEAGGQFDAATMARAIVNEFQPTQPFDSCVAVDLEGSNWGEALSIFRSFCRRFLDWIRDSAVNAEAAGAALRIAGVSVVKYSAGNLADITALAQAITALPSLPEVIARDIRSAEALFRSSVIARVTGNDYRNATGLSLFAPGSATVYGTNRADYMRLQFPSLTGWTAVLDALYNYSSESVRLISADTGEVLGPKGDVEFVVSLRGLPIDEATRDRLQRLVQRTVLGKLAEVDALIDASVVSLSAFTATAGSKATRGSLPAGIAVLSRAPTEPTRPNIQPFPIEGLDGASTRPSPRPIGDDLEFHAVVRGIRLDDATKTLIDAAIRSAVMQEIARIDNRGVRQIGIPGSDLTTRLPGHPNWRPGNPDPGEIFGLVAEFK
ncbi:MAG: hypothetical protein EOS11_32455 [Mesorhizobium sp.]|nr:MAG: hypothetical protein EOS11_32455 [Mesorhizobium sp.]